ncbi:MAG: hypothetical protein IT260_03775 [Saprospiraceae bacterium]|nr:hypothetical protein [Saprospiraceae bacterium]
MRQIQFNKYKNESYLQKLKDFAFKGSNEEHYYVFFGGTGAVGGQALIEMIRSFDFIFDVNPNWAENKPVFVVTTVNDAEIDRFITKLYNAFGRENRGEFTRADDGNSRARQILHKRTGLVIEFYLLQARPEFKNDIRALLRDQALPAMADILSAEASNITSPFEAFLEEYKSEKQLPAAFRFKAVISGIPVPSVAAYHFSAIDTILEDFGIKKNDPDRAIERQVKLKILEGFANDFGTIKKNLAKSVLIAHTTSVGGMYTIEDNKPVIRLGYAHSAQDDELLEKQFYAEELTRMYSALHLKILITAAAIGIDNIFKGASLPLQSKILKKYMAAAREGVLPFREAWLNDENLGQSVNRNFPFVEVSPFYPMRDEKGEVTGQLGIDFAFGVQKEKFTPPKIKVDYALRSGENGLFSIDNAYALYLNMKIATQEELSHILVFCALFGDDTQKPWFDGNGICYQTETENSSLVFAFLNNRSEFRSYQLSAFTPKAFQDLGSAKHQAELHTTGLYILLHRLSTLNPKLISEKITSKYRESEVVEFVDRNTEPLSLENVVGMDVEKTARRFGQLLRLNSAEEMAAFVGFNGNMQSSFVFTFFQHLLSAVKNAIYTITSLGTPILFDDEGQSRLLIGPYCAATETVMSHNDTLAKFIKDGSAKFKLRPEDYFEWLVANNGVVDLRPQATIVTTKTHIHGLKSKIKVVHTMREFKEQIRHIQEIYIRERAHPYFSSSGIVAYIGRITGLYTQVKAFDISLGTLNNWRSLFPVDSNLNHPLIPGIVEAMRMYSEGLGKITGFEHLYPGFGYFAKQ